MKTLIALLLLSYVAVAQPHTDPTNLSDITNTSVAKTNLSLGNVTNESKATMFTNAVFTGTFDVANGSIANADLANSAVANLSGTNTGDQTTISGNAATATTLATPRTINGVSFNGSANITAYTYKVNVQALTSSPADGATIFMAHLPKAPVTTSGQGGKIFVRESCTIKAADIFTYSGTAGTNENWSFYVRVNNTSETLIQTIGASASERSFVNSSMSVSLVNGDYFEIKAVNPTWATNPLTTIVGGTVTISVP